MGYSVYENWCTDLECKKCKCIIPHKKHAVNYDDGSDGNIQGDSYCIKCGIEEMEDEKKDLQSQILYAEKKQEIEK